ncbi:MAG: ABC transporter ATP-binding protein [Acidimicrobiales bacterium]
MDKIRSGVYGGVITPPETPEQVPIVELTGVSKRFGGVRVIDDLSLAVAAHEAVGVIGPNGAGKTTMLNLVAGDLRPEHGEVWFEGRAVTRLRADQRCRAGIARTSQVPRPYTGMSVFENVLVAAVFGSGRPVSERAAAPLAAEALDRTGLLAKANVGAASLTLLELKRLELARALAARPRVLLLDEIAGGLTEPEVHELVATIQTLRTGAADGLALVWIEHIVHALLAVVDRVVAVNFGRIVADGDPRTVVASPEVRETYLGIEPQPEVPIDPTAAGGGPGTHRDSPVRRWPGTDAASIPPSGASP